MSCRSINSSLHNLLKETLRNLLSDFTNNLKVCTEDEINKIFLVLINKGERQSNLKTEVVLHWFCHILDCYTQFIDEAFNVRDSLDKIEAFDLYIPCKFFPSILEIALSCLSIYKGKVFKTVDL